MTRGGATATLCRARRMKFLMLAHNVPYLPHDGYNDRLVFEQGRPAGR
jgi:hypothetical protein